MTAQWTSTSVPTSPRETRPRTGYRPSPTGHGFPTSGYTHPSRLFSTRVGSCLTLRRQSSQRVGVVYPPHTDFRPRCTPLAPDSCVAPKDYAILLRLAVQGAASLCAREAYRLHPRNRPAITRRRALLSGTRDAPRFPENPCATGI